MKWVVIECTRKACIYDTVIDGRTMFVLTIGMGKKYPPSDKPWYKRDSEGLLIVKGSAWRFPYTDNKEKMLEEAHKLFEKHC